MPEHWALVEGARCLEAPGEILVDNAAVVRIILEGKAACMRFPLRPNLDLWAQIWLILEDFGDFSIEWVKGHSQDKGNKRALDHLRKRRGRQKEKQ